MAERISLAEAYNNKDVVTQIAILKDKLDSIPDADLTNVVLKTGDQIIDGEKTFNDPIVANGGVVFANSGIHVNGTLEVDGDIIQNGSAYETHAEQVFTKNDLIVTREDAIGGIAAGQLSGIRVKKYDGVSDLNLGVDASGTMRVGDLGSEQPLLTREEAANLNSGDLLKWDGVNMKAVGSSMDTAPTANSQHAVTSDGIKTALDNFAKRIDSGSFTVANIPLGSSSQVVNFNHTFATPPQVIFQIIGLPPGISDLYMTVSSSGSSAFTASFFLGGSTVISNISFRYIAISP